MISQKLSIISRRIWTILGRTCSTVRRIAKRLLKVGKTAVIELRMLTKRSKSKLAKLKMNKKELILSGRFQKSFMISTETSMVS